jgi:hypothetical protein
MVKGRKKEKKERQEAYVHICTYVYTPPAMRGRRIGGAHGI